MPDELFVAILAAGASRRLGYPKQLVELNGEPLVRRQCRTALEAAVGPVALVLGCQREGVASAVSNLKIQLLTADDWAEGMAASVRTATRAAMAAGAAALLLLHCDQYALIPADLRHLRDAWAASPAAAHLSRHGDHLGPPAILPARFFPSMLTLKGDTGPRPILRGEDVREVPMPSASTDLDCSLDLATAKAKGFHFRDTSSTEPPAERES